MQAPTSSLTLADLQAQITNLQALMTNEATKVLHVPHVLHVLHAPHVLRVHYGMFMISTCSEQYMLFSLSMLHCPFW